MISRLNGKPSAVVAVYQLPGSNAVRRPPPSKVSWPNMK